jgi:hypothetical protein
MKTLVTVALGLLLSAAPTFTAGARVSQESLVMMGLDGMQAMSDVQGTEVRGTSAYYWPPDQMTYVTPAFQFRLVIQSLPTLVNFRQRRAARFPQRDGCDARCWAAVQTRAPPPQFFGSVSTPPSLGRRECPDRPAAVGLLMLPCLSTSSCFARQWRAPWLRC